MRRRAPSPLLRGWVFALACAACDSVVAGTMAPLEASSGAAEDDGSPASPAAPGGGAGGSSGEVIAAAGTGSNDAIGTAGKPSSACGNLAAVCRAPVATSEPLPGRALPPVQTQVTETVSLQRI